MSGNTADTFGASRRTVLKSAGGGLAASVAMGGTAHAREEDDGTEESFVATMSPDNAVPDGDQNQPYSVENASGMGVFTVIDESVLEYTVMLAKVTGLDGLHVHRGGPDENGPHLAELFNGGPTEELNGVFVSHRLSAEDTCTSDPPGDHCLNEGFEPLLTAMREGDSYLQAHVGNEVLRGQIRE